MTVVSLTTQEVGITKEVISTLLSQVSEASQQVYMEAIRQFMTYTTERFETHPYQNPYGAVVAYRKYMMDIKYQPSTANKKLSAIKQFMKVVAIHNLITLDQAYAVEGIKSIKSSGSPLREWLDEEQARNLLYKPDTSTVSGKRDQLILMFGLVLGLRREEMINVTWGQFKQIGGYWIIQNLAGKGNSVNVVEVPDKYAKMINDFGREEDSKPIIVSVDRYGNKRNSMTKEAINYILGKYDVKPHTLRRSSATMVIKNGGTIREAQQHLRHANQSTTEGYIKSAIELGNSAVNRIDL